MSYLQKLISLAGLIVLASVSFAAPSQAQAVRTWVSGTGSDANPCSFTAPCKTFAGAIANTAAGGEIDALTPGGYGTVTITKSVTIDGGAGQVSSILASSGFNGITIATAGVVVTIKNLSINASNSSSAGIYITNATRVNVINCDIMNTEAYGVGFFPSTAGELLTVTNTTIHNSAAYGIAVAPASGLSSPARVTLENVQLIENGIGLLAMDNSNVVVSHSNMSNNSFTGVSATATGANAVIDLIDSTVANNGGDGVAASGTGNSARIRIAGVAIYSNIGNAIGGTVMNTTSFGNNAILDNGTDTIPSGSTPLR